MDANSQPKKRFEDSKHPKIQLNNFIFIFIGILFLFCFLFTFFLIIIMRKIFHQYSIFNRKSK